MNKGAYPQIGRSFSKVVIEYSKIFTPILSKKWKNTLGKILLIKVTEEEIENLNSLIIMKQIETVAQNLL